MKRFLSVCFCLGVMFYLSAAAPDWGVADTLEYHTEGPGIDVCKIYFQGKKMLIWVTTINLNNPLNKIEQAQSRNQLPDVTRWTVPEFSRQNTRPGHKVCVAFNHDFFSYDLGVGIGLNISEGEITWTKWGRSVLAISQDKTAGVFYPNIDSKVILKDNTEVGIDYYNAPAGTWYGDCILFSRFNAKELTEAGTYIQIQPMDKWTVNGNNVRCKVLNVSTSPIQTTQTEYTIWARGAKINAFDGKVAIGDTVQISQKCIQTKFGVPLQNIVAGFHGYPSIAYEGQLHDGEYNDFENGREYELSSRTMAGMSQDGKKLYVVVTEMSTQSAAVNCIDLANYMLSIGCWNVVNFDSGGSAAIVTNHEMQNIPGRGSIRPVIDAMLAVSIAPEDDSIASYRFSQPTIYPTIVSLTPVKLLSFNQYDEVIGRDEKGFSFRCEPTELGYVDADYIFHAGTQAINGTIFAEKNGKTAQLNVRIQQASEVLLTPDSILIDAVRKYPIQLKCKVGNSLFDMDPSAFNWTVQDETVCKIEDGVLVGLNNGKTTAVGSLNGIEKTLKITVERGTNFIVTENYNDLSLFNVTNSGLQNIVYQATESGTGTQINFDFISSRNPFLQIEKDIPFYGLPDSLTLYVKTAADFIKEVQFYFKSSTNDDFATVVVSGDSISNNLIEVPFATDMVAWDITEFPLTLKKIKVIFKTSAAKQNYNFEIRDLKAVYPEKTQTGVRNVLSENRVWTINSPDHANAIVNYTLDAPSEVIFSVFGADGKLISQINCIGKTGNNMEIIPTANWSSGIYLIKINAQNINATCKIIIN
ncbi:MAG: T9SS type A sorting domain-containing protein [Sphingobacteriia bacterium]|nr:T9SS type A sorting domain-containing protein [Sphingobacteriia bacterium]